MTDFSNVGTIIGMICGIFVGSVYYVDHYFFSCSSFDRFAEYNLVVGVMSLCIFLSFSLFVGIVFGLVDVWLSGDFDSC